MIRRILTLAYESALSRLCTKSSVKIETTPLSSGISTSAIGSVAKSEIISVMTTSYGCSCANCRLPISRSTTAVTKKSTIVRKKPVSIFLSPFRIG